MGNHIIPDRQKLPHLTRVDFETAKAIYCLQKGNVVKMEGLAEYLLCDEFAALLARARAPKRTLPKMPRVA